MFGLSLWEGVLILIVALLVIGPQRLPELLRALGKGMRQLREASAEVRQAMDEPLREFREPFDDLQRDLRSATADLQEVVERETHGETHGETLGDALGDALTVDPIATQSESPPALASAPQNAPKAES